MYMVKTWTYFIDICSTEGFCWADHPSIDFWGLEAKFHGKTEVFIYEKCSFDTEISMFSKNFRSVSRVLVDDKDPWHCLMLSGIFWLRHSLPSSCCLQDMQWVVKVQENHQRLWVNMIISLRIGSKFPRALCCGSLSIPRLTLTVVSMFYADLLRPARGCGVMNAPDISSIWSTTMRPASALVHSHNVWHQTFRMSNQRLMWLHPKSMPQKIHFVSNVATNDVLVLDLLALKSEEPADYTLFFQADAADHLHWGYLSLVPCSQVQCFFCAVRLVVGFPHIRSRICTWCACPLSPTGRHWYVMKGMLYII